MLYLEFGQHYASTFLLVSQMSLFQGVYCDEWCINLSLVNPRQLWVWADDAQGPKSDKPLESHLEIAASWGAIQIQFPAVSMLKSLSFHHVLSLDVPWWQYIKHSFFSSSYMRKLKFVSFVLEGLFILLGGAAFVEVGMPRPYWALHVWKLVCHPIPNLSMHRQWFQCRRFNKYLNRGF